LFKTEILDGLSGTDIEFIDPSTNEGDSGIVAVHLMTPSSVVTSDWVVYIEKLSFQGEKCLNYIPNITRNTIGMCTIKVCWGFLPTAIIEN
jgi:hypothetical protein